MNIPREFFNTRILCDEDYDFADDVELQPMDVGWKLGSDAEPLQKNFYFTQTLFSDDKMLWESIKEMLGESVKMAEMSVKGSFEIRLVYIESVEIKMFDIANLSRLISNHAHKISFGESTMFPYSSMWLTLKKLSPLDWGKIKLSHQIHFFNQERGKLDLLFKKVSKPALDADKPSWVLLDDLSRKPIFRFGEDPQTERLQKYVDGIISKGLIDRMQFRLYGDKREAVDLVEQFEKVSDSLEEKN